MSTYLDNNIWSFYRLSVVVLFLFILVLQHIQLGRENNNNNNNCEYLRVRLQPTHVVLGENVPQKPIRPIRNREEIGNVLEEEGFKIGVELGVQRGVFTSQTLSRWKSCESYLLVDIWQPLENYADLSNKDQSGQDKNYQETLKNTAKWKDKIQICRNLTTVCAAVHNTTKFDYIYVDARHDYKGVLRDLEDWWPLLREGGIMAGHDFVTQKEGPEQTKQDWTKNYDGTIDFTGRAVYGAVVDFFAPKNKQIVQTYREMGWHSWLVRK